MKSVAAISARINEIRNQLSVIDSRQSEELKKHYKQRDRRLLLFLNEERRVYEYALAQLKWSLSDQA